MGEDESKESKVKTGKGGGIASCEAVESRDRL